MLDRRELLTGLAALPLASLPVPASPDPFLDLCRRALEARAYANTKGLRGEEFDAAMDRLFDIEQEGMEAAPTTIEGAIAGLEWARYEHIEAGGCDDDIVLAMIDGALDVLRAQMTGVPLGNAVRAPG